MRHPSHEAAPSESEHPAPEDASDVLQDTSASERLAADALADLKPELVREVAGLFASRGRNNYSAAFGMLRSAGAPHARLDSHEHLRHVLERAAMEDLREGRLGDLLYLRSMARIDLTGSDILDSSEWQAAAADGVAAVIANVKAAEQALENDESALREMRQQVRQGKRSLSDYRALLAACESRMRTTSSGRPLPDVLENLDNATPFVKMARRADPQLDELWKSWEENNRQKYEQFLKAKIFSLISEPDDLQDYNG